MMEDDVTRATAEGREGGEERREKWLEMGLIKGYGHANSRRKRRRRGREADERDGLLFGCVLLIRSTSSIKASQLQ